MAQVRTTKTGSGETNRARRATGLGRQRIIDVAIEVIDEAGMSGLTMRRLGAALGVDAMSVYGYFENKAALLDAVVEHTVARLSTYDLPLPPSMFELIIDIAKHYRTVLLEHPNLAPVVASRPLPQRNLRESVDIGLALFRGAGYREDIPLAADTMITYTLGFIVQEAGHRSNRAELGEVEGEQRAEVLRHLDELPLDAIVQRRMLERRLDLQASRDQQFETGLRAMLRGLRDGLGYEEPAPSRTAPDQPGGRGGT